jgi:hypothetical protein
MVKRVYYCRLGGRTQVQVQQTVQPLLQDHKPAAEVQDSHRTLQDQQTPE